MTGTTGTTAERLNAAMELIGNFPDSSEGSDAKARLSGLQEEHAKAQAEANRIREIEARGRQWVYHASSEGMTDKPERYAIVESTNTLDLDFPYSGMQKAKLTLRKHPRWGNDVIVSLERGQILCQSYGDCAVGVRFDDGQVLRFKGNPPADNSSETVFIPAFDTFAKRLPKSSRVRIEVHVYQNGAVVLDFDVSGFKPERK